MTTAVNPDRSHLPKFNFVAQWMAAKGIQSVLDVGCRDCVLQAVLAENGLDTVTYAGSDLFQNEQGTVDYVGDFTQGIPVANESYELVTALDVLEHLDDLQAGLDEMDRIAKRAMIIALPNMAHFRFRLRFLLTGRVNSKYDLKYDYGLDRHRWFTVLPQTNRYFKTYCQQKGYTLNMVPSALGNSRLSLLENILRTLRFPASWHIWQMLYVIEKPA